MRISKEAIKKHKQLDLLQLADAKNDQIYDLLETCAYKNCFFTCNKSLIAEADALLVHDIRDDFNYKIKPTASQVLIFWNDEANPVDKRLDELNFNWTISFRHESEASYCTYGCYEQNKFSLKHFDFSETIRKNFVTRKNSSVWFVSNCNSEYRINFAIKMAQTFSVKIYGNCMSSIESKIKLSPNKNFLELNDSSCQRDSTCELEILELNKFFLAFENSNCSSYITEKFWRSLHYGIIPVVIQPNKRFYETIAPKDSFIHASDFDFDSKKLTAYLNKVSTDFDLYFKHLKWKHKYSALYRSRVLEQKRMCELCWKLNTYDSLEYYNSISSYFNNNCYRE